MKIAIHNRPGSFSDRWILYCKRNNIGFKIVNAYESNIVEQLKDCDTFMWHHHQSIMADTLFARQLIYSLEAKGIKCFPDFNTTWHFDDKVGQKYLLEAVNAPHVPSYVFYSKGEALSWIDQTVFPKVFKLRSGAGASNVRLVQSASEAKRLVNKAFGKGFHQTEIAQVISDGWKKHKIGKISLGLLFKEIVAYYFKADSFHKQHSPEKGYVYFQDFIPNNSFDIRVCIIGDKAFALKRLVREDDFRASGSGRIIYDRKQIDERCVKIAFEANVKLKSQCIAFDFIFDEKNNPLIVEFSYGFASGAYDSCEGWWDDSIVWHPGGGFDFCGWMVEDLLTRCGQE